MLILLFVYFFLDQQQPGASSSVTYFWQVYSSKERMMESLHYSNDILFSKNFCLSAFLLQCFLDVQRLAEDYHRFDLQYTHCLHILYENVSSMYYLVLLEVEKRLPKKNFSYINLIFLKEIICFTTINSLLITNFVMVFRCILFSVPKNLKMSQVKKKSSNKSISRILFFPS